MRRVVLLIILSSTCCLSTYAQSAAATVQRLQQRDACNKFSGTVKAEWLTDGRNMKLLEELTYVEPYCRAWVAPAGAVVDGASIPRFAWSVIGGPFEGRYRDASVIHDVACEEQSAPWEYVHLTFYYAMLARGVDTKTAKIMYAAVYHFGPRWDPLTRPSPTGKSGPRP
jgi:hypothetical protein